MYIATTVPNMKQGTHILNGKTEHHWHPTSDSLESNTCCEFAKVAYSSACQPGVPQFSMGVPT